jgi:hypothetical protein
MVSVDIPPGIIFFASRAPKLAIPPLVTYFFVTLIRSHAGIDVPTWLLCIFFLLSFPVALTVHVQWRLFMDRRGAARLGAELAPCVPSWIAFLRGGGRGSVSWYPGAFSFSESGAMVNVFATPQQADWTMSSRRSETPSTSAFSSRTGCVHRNSAG